jgi:hypothetical protein
LSLWAEARRGDVVVQLLPERSVRYRCAPAAHDRDPFPVLQAA